MRKSVLFMFMVFATMMFAGCAMEVGDESVDEDVLVDMLDGGQPPTSDDVEVGRLQQALSSYGLYGTVTYNGNQLADGITVNVSKKNGSGQWVPHGTTVTSGCGYYTYDTGATGDYLVNVNAYTWLRPSNCGSRISLQWWMGTSNSGSVTLWNPQKLVNLNYVP